MPHTKPISTRPRANHPLDEGFLKVGREGVVDNVLENDSTCLFHTLKPVDSRALHEVINHYYMTVWL